MKALRNSKPNYRCRLVGKIANLAFLLVTVTRIPGRNAAVAE